MDAELLRSDALQAAEESVGGSVAAGERDAEPAEECAEKWIEPAGAGEGEAETGVEAGAARDEAEAEHERDSDHREAHADERAPESFHQRDGAHAEKQAGNERCEETAGAGGGEPVEIVARGFGSGFGDDGNVARNQAVKVRPVPARRTFADGAVGQHNFEGGSGGLVYC